MVGDITDPKAITTGFAFYEMLGEILVPYKLNLQSAGEEERVEKGIIDIFDALAYRISS